MKNEIDVVGAFKTREGASNAAERLVAEGFMQQNISIVMGDEARKHFMTIKDGNKGLEGVAAGGVVGGVTGAVMVALAGLATVAIPGLGLVVAGPLVAAVAGGGAGAAAGGLIGGLIGLGISEHEAKLYEETLKAGGVLVAVRTANSEDAKRARGILDEVGSVRVDSESGRAIHA